MKTRLFRKVNTRRQNYRQKDIKKRSFSIEILNGGIFKKGSGKKERKRERLSCSWLTFIWIVCVWTQTSTLREKAKNRRIQVTSFEMKQTKKFRSKRKAKMIHFRFL